MVGGVLLPIVALVLASEAKRRVLALEDEIRRLRREIAEAAEEAARLRRAAEAGAAPPGGAVAAAGPAVGAPTGAATTAAPREATAAAVDRAPPDVAAPVADAAGAPPPPPLPVIERGVVLPRETAAPRRREPAAALSVEMFLGRRVFLVAGVVVLLLGVAWGLKIAIDRGILGPAGRVTMGALAGLAAMAGGEHLRRRGLAAYGTALMGGGLGALYLSTWFASGRYDLVPRGAGFAAMGALTALGAVLAVLRDAPLLAHLGFLGGFLAPALLSTGEDRLGSLTAWLLLLDAGVVVVAWKRRWPGIDAAGALATPVYFVAWRQGYFDASRWAEGGALLAAVAAGAVAASLLPAVARRERPHATALLAALFSGFAATVIAISILVPEHRVAAGLGVLALASAYAGVARALHVRAGGGGEPLSAMAVATLAVAVPVLLGREDLPPAWAAVGACTVFVGARHGLVAARFGGGAMVALSLLVLAWNRLGTAPGATAYVPFVNGAFVAALVVVASPLAAGETLRRAGKAAGLPFLLAGTWAAGPLLVHEILASRGSGRPSLPPLAWSAFAASAWLVAACAAWRRAEAGWRGAAALGGLLPLALALLLVFGGGPSPFTFGWNAAFLGAAAVAAGALVAGALSPGAPGMALRAGALALLLAALTAEIHRWGEGRPLAPGATREAARFVAQVVISVAWALYAAALLGLGLRFDRGALRWGGIVVFGLALAKVLLLDMARLDAVYRVFSFLALGGLLLGASYLYWRRRTSEPAAGGAPGDGGPSDSA